MANHATTPRDADLIFILKDCINNSTNNVILFETWEKEWSPYTIKHARINKIWADCGANYIRFHLLKLNTHRLWESICSKFWHTIVGYGWHSLDSCNGSDWYNLSSSSSIVFLHHSRQELSAQPDMTFGIYNECSGCHLFRKILLQE